MDGVERVMVLGIFAVIVAILSIAAWGMTGDDLGVAGATDGGVSGKAQLITSGDEAPPRKTEDGTSKPTGNRARPVALGEAGGEPDATGERRGGRGARPVDPNGPLAGADGSGRPGMPPLSSSTPVGPALGRTPEVLDPPSQAPAKAVEPGKGEPAAPEGGAAAGKPTTVKYTVVKGDTMWGIVRRHFGEGDTKAQLQLVQQLNPKLDVNRIEAGDELVLPVNPPAELVSKPVTQRVKAGTRLYTIQSGENLWSIAEAQLGNKQRWRDVYELNRDTIQDPERIHAGMTILLPEK